MANKMLIDATHPEETRVVVLRGNRVEEFDFESAHRKQLRGNIYLAKVTRVEPSLQAAFVDYGGNRHGFLAFSEIHPDYYQIPVADRQALIDEEQRAHRAADDEIDRRSRRPRDRGRSSAARRNGDDAVHGHVAEAPIGEPGDEHAGEHPAEVHQHAGEPEANAAAEHGLGAEAQSPAPAAESQSLADMMQPSAADDAADAARQHLESAEPAGSDTSGSDLAQHEEAVVEIAETGEASTQPAIDHADAEDDDDEEDDAEDGEGENGEEIVESVGGADAMEEMPDRTPRYRRQYKIQEVIKRRQVMLVQVVKEERGTKGAALTTYLSLAGRYSVLMPNTARGGGISRKITNGEDRSRLKEIAQELEVPEGMGVILRTAGASRTKTEIKRDFEYLLRLWETVRDLTLKSTAPTLVYEEGSLVKRSIRDLYSKDIDEVVVAGPDAYQEAKDFMRMLMPSHAKNVKPYAETQPLLSRHGVENQLDAMFSPIVQLRSGGYIVINQTEALVAIDVNSGRATREHHIEDTALKTNMEAADEIARQLRLRDLAGLIVIDFIDMDEKRNNRSVERRMKECLKQDRARIQVGRISHFGLLEMSRQRIRTSVLESSTEKCPYCGGTGHVRSVSSLALQVLRALEEQLMRGGTHNLVARTRPDVALYVLNQKRAHLRALEERFAITITISADETVMAPQAFAIDRGEQVHTIEAARLIAAQSEATVPTVPLEEDDIEETGAAVEDDEAVEAVEAVEDTGETAASAEPQEGGGPRRRRRRRRRGRENGAEAPAHDHYAASEENGEPSEPAADAGGSEDQLADHEDADDLGDAPQPQEQHDRSEPNGERRRRRRGRRGGRRNRQERDRNGAAPQDGYGSGPQPEFTQDQLDQPDRAGSEFTHATADLDAPPAYEATHAEPSRPVAPEPAPSEARYVDVAPPQPPAAEREPPRRRSTVREAAPGASEAESTSPSPPSPAVASAPAAEPVVTEAGDTASSNQPRRKGWWSRRFAGD